MIDQLLQPLNAFHIAKVQQGLSVYTVARFGSDVEFADPQAREQLSRFLSAVAQVEESGHAGAIPGKVMVTNEVLNNRHWAAVGLLGAAHLVADQPPPDGHEEHAFNEQRVPRVRDKYFVPYLMATFQRLFLDRTVREASSIALSHSQDTGNRLAKLREKTLEFAVRGHFVQVSSREVLHRFYRVAQRGLDVPEAWAEVNYAISNLDRRFADERDRHVSKTMADNLVSINRVQQAVHVIEYIVVGTYLAEVWHLATGGYDFFHGWHGTVGVVTAFLVGLAFVNIVIRQVERKRKED